MLTTHNLGFPKSYLDRRQIESKKNEWQQQSDSDFLSLGCTGVSDPMVTMMDLLGHRSEYKHFKAYQDAPWFGSEVRCVVPELTPSTSFSLDAAALIKDSSIGHLSCNTSIMQGDCMCGLQHINAVSKLPGQRRSNTYLRYLASELS